MLRALLPALLLAVVSVAHSQSGYPRKPILMLVPLLPEVPTVAESLPGFEFFSSFAVVTPAGTPKEIVARLNAEIAKATQDPAVREKLVAQGFGVIASSPEELARRTREQLESYRRLFKEVGIRAE